MGIDTALSTSSKETAVDYDGTFWKSEQLKFAEPHFRLRKVAPVVNRLAGSRSCQLLDVGCGPATLARLLRPNIQYFGIDIAAPRLSPNLRAADVRNTRIGFEDRTFDIVVALGLFEYLGTCQVAKLEEIVDVLAPGGKFLLSYTNFGHRQPTLYEAFSNIRSPVSFRETLERFFVVERMSPISHNWHHSQPVRPLVTAANMHFNLDVPLVSPRLAVEYMFICSSR